MSGSRLDLELPILIDAHVNVISSIVAQPYYMLTATIFSEYISPCTSVLTLLLRVFVAS